MPLPKAAGVSPISGERAIKKASDLKGDINAFNNVKTEKLAGGMDAAY